MGRMALLLLFAIAFASHLFLAQSAALSTTGTRVLAVVSSDADRKRFKTFFKTFSARGFNISYSLASSNPQLYRFEKPIYDHVIHLASSSPLSKGLSPQKIVEFMQDGGNVFMALDSSAQKSHIYLANQFGVHFGDSVLEVVVPTSNKTSPTTNIFTTNEYSHLHSLIPSTSDIRKKRQSVIYRGTGHFIDAQRKDEILSVLYAPPQARFASAFRKAQPRLVSAFEASNNARIVFFGSLDALDDKWVSVQAKVLGLSKDQVCNQELWKEISRWVFSEKSVYRFTTVTHHMIGVKMEENDTQYQFGKDIEYTVGLQEYDGQHGWRPFETSKVMFTVTMLDPRIRLKMPMHQKSVEISKEKGNHSVYKLKTKLPDIVGIFTFTAQVMEPGYSRTQHNERVTVGPLRHDANPRYFMVALPYYMGVFAQIMGTIALIIFLLGSRDAKEKKQDNNTAINVVQKTAGAKKNKEK